MALLLPVLLLQLPHSSPWPLQGVLQLAGPRRCLAGGAGSTAQGDPSLPALEVAWQLMSWSVMVMNKIIFRFQLDFYINPFVQLFHTC